jgi:hypothetical protein
MTGNGKLKSSAELQAELGRIDALVEITRGDESNARQEIRRLARGAITDDGKEQLAEIRNFEHKLGQNLMDLKRLADARCEVEAELAEAVAAEDLETRKKDAAEAEAFAESLPNLFGECDRHLADFRRSYTACIDAMRGARSKGWSVPSEELMTSKLTRAIKSAFFVSELRALDMSPISSVERTTFAQLGESYSRAIRGGAKHSAMPKPIVTNNAAAVANTESKLPKHVDIGTRLPGDGPDFEVRVPTRR